MPNFAGTVPVDSEVLASGWPGRNADAYTHALQPAWDDFVVDDPAALDPVETTTNAVGNEGQKSPSTQVDHDGTVADYCTTPAIDFFETVHVVPRILAFGQVLSTVEKDITVFSAFRKLPHDWTTFTNNAGAGVSLLNQPSLTHSLVPLLGVDMEVEVLATGPPSVNSTLDFTFTLGLVAIPITIERVVLWAVAPELPYGEFLEFQTDILEHIDGGEQRVKNRKNPRQTFEWDMKLTQGPERSRLDNLLFSWQFRSFGVPIWHEATKLTVAALANDTVINVQDTAYADYRTTGSNLVLLYQDQTTFDVLELNSLTSTTLTLDSPLANAYAVGTLVMPLRVGVMKKLLRGRRHPVGLSELRAQFRILDNDANLGDTSAFSSFNGKVLLDDHNGMSNTVRELFQQEIIVLDNETGLTYQDSPWTRNKHGWTKVFLTNTRQGLWEVRQLIHALGGKLTSFYLPTFADDMELSASLVSGSPALAITHVGYSQFVAEVQPRDLIRITFNNGDPALLRTIQSSVVTSSTVETLTLDANWPSNYAIADVRRIEYVELVRFNSDRIAFRHQVGDRVTKIQAPVKVVLT